MKTFIISWVSEFNSKVFITIPAKTMQDAIRLFLMKRVSSGINEAVSFNVKKLQEN
jgi:hypothetical protein